eukprot:SAG31_NODE_5849_length_2297_cov_1.282530_2_plen_70_part_00
MFEPSGKTADGTSVITSADLKRISYELLGQNMTAEELGEMIEEADVDGNGVISEEEFVRITSLRAALQK